MWTVHLRLDGEWSLLGSWDNLCDAQEIMDRIESCVLLEMKLTYEGK